MFCSSTERLFWLSISQANLNFRSNVPFATKASFTFSHFVETVLLPTKRYVACDTGILYFNFVPPLFIILFK